MHTAAPGKGTLEPLQPLQSALPFEGCETSFLSFASEAALAEACHQLIGEPCVLPAGGLRRAMSEDESAALRSAIVAGEDPLGSAFLALRTPRQRRLLGAVYTQPHVIEAMLHWIEQQVERPVRIVDPGAGSGRFLLAAAKRFPGARLVGVELDPLAALMLRANAHVLGVSQRLTLQVDDYRSLRLEPLAGATAFIGNPPYVRHHDIADEWKNWYASSCSALGIKASTLAGLHLHFFLQTRLLASVGDVGAFITSAEWMDVNYGSALRRLLLDELGGIALHVLEPTVEAFPGTATTAAIACFRVGETVNPMRVRSVDALARLDDLNEGIDIPRDQLQAAPRWSVIVRPSQTSTAGDIELGELFRVHRGQVTGANDVWIAGDQASGLPDRVKMAAVTKAKDLIQAGAHLRSAAALRRVIDLPAELDDFTKDERRRISAFLSWAKLNGADQSYIARHRKAWWSVSLKAPAPILCTYMARRPPQFTVNACEARHINVAHGLYPREPLAAGVMARLVAWLNQKIHTGSGRTYAGGLTKFEPKEIERLRVPSLEALLA